MEPQSVMKSDPWNWTIDQVVENICHKNEIWSERPTSRRPEASRFESTLRENAIDGPTLLNDVDLNVLRTDLGLNSLGERSAISYAIEVLRNRSVKYHSHRASVSSRQFRIDEQARTFSPAPTPPPVFLAHKERSATPIPPTNVDSTSTITSLTLPQVMLPAVTVVPSTEVKARPGEVIIQGPDGSRKRRKLVLLPHQPVEIKKDRTVDHTYLGAGKLQLNDIFFDGTTAPNNDNDPDDVQSDDDDFYITGSATPRGRKGFVSKRMRHFLQSAPIVLSSSKVVKHLYPERLIIDGKARHAALFTRNDDGQVQLSKRDAAMLDHELSGNTEGGTEWDYLAEKWNKMAGADLELPALGDSDDEETESLAEEIAKEALEREAALKKTTHVLTFDEAKVVVDEAVKELEERWNTEKRPLREKKAYTIWREAKGHKKLLKMSEARQQLARLTDRLKKLQDEICENEWRKRESLQIQCAILELTVFDRQDIIFKIQVWEQSIPPAAPLKASPKVPKKIVKQHASDEESLHSDTDLDENLSDFVEIDDASFTSPEADIVADYQPMEIEDDTEKALPMEVEENIPVKEEKKQSPAKSKHVASPVPSEDSVLGDAPTVLTTKRSNAETFSAMDIIDLTASSPLVSPILTPVFDDTLESSNDEPVSLSQDSPGPVFTTNPEDATESEIDSWELATLDENSDRCRIIIKLLRTLDAKFRFQIERQFLNERDKPLRDKVGEGLRALKRRESKIAIYSNPEVARIFMTARLYACWIEATYRHISGTIPPSTMMTAQKLSDFSGFYKFVKSIIKTVDTSDVDDDDSTTPRKKGKKVLQDHHARLMRKAAHDRRDQALEKEKQINSQLMSTDPSRSVSGVFINPSKGDDQEFIYVHDHIAEKLKPHQIGGIRFMWREIVEDGQVRSDGCLLAHTMGLGKTMQTIAILVTIAEASASRNPKIRDQIPEELRGSRTLILCPASLIENWKLEFEKWTPPDAQNLGPIFDVTPERNHYARYELVASWYRLGGVLIMGYERFRTMLANKASKKTNVTPLSVDDHASLETFLLKGPKIIVADEAHKLRNDTTGVGQAAKRFESTSRIALTGSPLANNLQDYFSMIEWVAPGFLGNREEFNADYRKPIEQGNYADSSPAERRRSLRKLDVLKREIDPKVHRADITALSHDLKRKTEIVIKLPLTRSQHAAYSRFVQSLLHQSDTSTSQAKLMDWVSVLSLLVDHPYVFISKLRDRKKQQAEKRKLLSRSSGVMQSTENLALDETNGEGADLTTWGARYDGLPSSTAPVKARQARQGSEEIDFHDDVDASKLGLSETMIDAQEETFREMTRDVDVEDPILSNKVGIVKQILIHSKRVGDKVLIFSHFLPVLSYLEKLVATIEPKMTSLRLDGSTKIADRVPMVDRFNKGENDVFLISTRAGGLGLNIVGANRVILMDFSWNPSWEEQAVGRAYRIGQEKRVFVYHLVTAGTFEEKLHHITLFKRQLAARVVDAKTPRRSALKTNELLFEPRDVGKEDLTHVAGMDDVFDFVLASAAGKDIRSVSTTETLHAESNETLTEEEQKEADQEYQMRQLRVNDPLGYQKAREAEQMRLLNLPRLGGPPTYGGTLPLSAFSATQPARAPPPLSTAMPADNTARADWLTPGAAYGPRGVQSSPIVDTGNARRVNEVELVSPDDSGQNSPLPDVGQSSSLHGTDRPLSGLGLTTNLPGLGGALPVVTQPSRAAEPGLASLVPVVAVPLDQPVTPVQPAATAPPRVGQTGFDGAISSPQNAGDGSVTRTGARKFSVNTSKGWRFPWSQG